MAFTKINTKETIYHLNGEPWTLETLRRLSEQIEADGFPFEAEIQIDYKNGSIKVTTSETG
jgi:hypothetical protein